MVSFNSNKRRCSERWDAANVKVNVALALRHRGFTYLIKYDSREYNGSDERQRQELTQHTFVQRQCLLTDMSATVVVYTLCALVIASLLVSVNVKRRQE